jgi:hypothetical protein
MATTAEELASQSQQLEEIILFFKFGNQTHKHKTKKGTPSVLTNKYSHKKTNNLGLQLANNDFEKF